MTTTMEAARCSAKATSDMAAYYFNAPLCQPALMHGHTSELAKWGVEVVCCHDAAM